MPLQGARDGNGLDYGQGGGGIGDGYTPTDKEKRIYVGNSNQSYYVKHPNGSYTFGITPEEGDRSYEGAPTFDMNATRIGWGFSSFHEFIKNEFTNIDATDLAKEEGTISNPISLADMHFGEGGYAYLLRKAEGGYQVVARLSDEDNVDANHPLIVRTNGDIKGQSFYEFDDSGLWVEKYEPEIKSRHKLYTYVINIEMKSECKHHFVYAEGLVQDGQEQ